MRCGQAGGSIGPRALVSDTSSLALCPGATLTGAEIMGRQDEFGSLERGKLADVLVVDGDVLADISVLEDRRRFIAVLQGGVIKAGQLTAPTSAATASMA